MKSDYWNVTDDQVIEKTGKPLADWMKIVGAKRRTQAVQLGKEFGLLP